MSLENRKREAVQRKLKSLDDEWKAWLDQSEASQPYEKHHSQIRAVLTALRGLRQRTEDEWKGAKVGTALASAANVERLVLAVWRIWEFFRSKLVQRREPRFVDYLTAADELAWACYEPACARVHKDHAAAGMKEPPLVFLNGGASPFALARDHAFRAEDVAGELLTDRAFKMVLDRLPVPVIGVPWHQVWHLPDALVISHEVGHAVENDAGLMTRLESVVERALPEDARAMRWQAWKMWLPETFADVYGALAVGPAFASSLMDFIASASPDVEGELRVAPMWGHYPTAALRIQIACAALRCLSKEPAAKAADIETTWITEYPAHAMTQFEPDVRRVVEAMVESTYPTLGGASLREVIAFTPEHWSAADSVKKTIVAGEAVGPTDIRALFAAARDLFDDDPQGFATNGYDLTMLNAIKSSIAQGVRAAPPPLSPKEAAARDADLTNSGSSLFDDLVSLL